MEPLGNMYNLLCDYTNCKIVEVYFADSIEEFFVNEVGVAIFNAVW